jgi:hypothetical protein
MLGLKGLFGKKQSENGPAKSDGQTAAAQPEFPSVRKVGAGLIEIGQGGAEPDTNAAYWRISQFLLGQYNDDGGRRFEASLNAAGALAGFAAQQAIWEGIVRPGRMTIEQAFVRVGTTDGGTYYFGDFLNMILASTEEGQLSIWRLVAGAAVGAGAAKLPDLSPLFKACAATVGGPQFGIPTWATGEALHELPRDALRHWPTVRTILQEAQSPPLHWPLELARTAQTLLESAKATLPPDKAALIVMEAAIPMSKVDPRSVPGGSYVD